MIERTKENLTLTPRLQAIADRVSDGARLVDVGTDHGHLPLWLLTQGRLTSAIASDLREGPLTHAQENARLHGLSLFVQFRLAAGLDGVLPSECDTISIAGMGGETIIEILQAAPWTAEGNHTLLLQPMTMLPQLRQWLWQSGYEIEEETVCTEGKRHYLVWTVRGGAACKMVALPDCYFSSALLCAPRADIYLTALLRREQYALAGMKRGQQVSKEQLMQQQAVVQTLQTILEEQICQR